jgi:hypothetical protein
MNGTVRVLAAALLATLCAACGRDIEVSAAYLNLNDDAAIFPCDQPQSMWRVHDSALAAAYARQPAPSMPLFVRLRGVKADSGRIYGSAHYFQVKQVLEVRPRRSGECPTSSDSAALMLSAAHPPR